MQVVILPKECLINPLLITILRKVYFVWQKLGGDHADGGYEIPYVIGW